MASPLTLRSTTRSSCLRDSDGDDLRGAGAPPEEEEVVTEGLFKAGVIPLVVRLSTSRADRVITRDVRTLSFRSAIPGGFASCEIQLDRPLSLDPDEIQPYGDLYVYDGRNGATVWQGRMEDPGRRRGGQGEVWTVRAVGPAARSHDRAVPLIYVDRSLERWKRAPRSHASARDTTQNDPGFGNRTQFSCSRGVVATFAPAWIAAREYKAIEEAGMKLAAIDYNWQAGVTSALWRIRLVVNTGGGADTVARDEGFNVAGGGLAVAVVVADWPNGSNRALMEMRRITSNQTVANDDTWCAFANMWWTAMRYLKDGTEKVAGYTNNHVLASEVVEDLLGRLLVSYDGANAVVDATTEHIHQLAYPDGVTPEEVLEDLMLIESSFYWAVWGDTPAGGSRFEWRTWPTSIRYEADAKAGFTSPASATDLYNAVSVRWTDQLGNVRTTRRTQTVPELDAAGLIREAKIDLGDVMGASTANPITIADNFLAEHLIPPSAGTLQVSTPIFDKEQGREVQPWEIRPGHLIRVRGVLPRVDALNATARDAVTVFRLVGVDYNADSNTASLELDSQARTLEGLLSETGRRLERLRKR